MQAGAISAGAYTAGVIDFLIEALDEWELHRGEPGVPKHEVRLKAISGASAGAMTAAIAAVALQSETRPVHWGYAEPESYENRLYDAWVTKIDIRDLLATDDLEISNPAIRSLLNCGVLQRIAEEAIQTQLRQQPRRYVHDPLTVVFSVSNLRGVPYGFKMYIDGKYIMMNHMDNMHFHVGTRPAGHCDARYLDPRDLSGRSPTYVPDEWSIYLQSALASGAFPIGLAARHLWRPARDYGNCLDTGICKASEPIPNPFNFVAVDGGLMDNEPLKLARTVLCGGLPQEGPTKNQCGLLTKRALVLVDPFPNVTATQDDYEEDDRLLQIAVAMFSALKEQARFHADELAAAENEDVFSRFAISPVRRNERGEVDKKRPMCSACMGGFGGFLKHAFRRYDFHLGRRNCQRFLERHFYLPEENVLFDADRDSYVRYPLYMRDDEGKIIERQIWVPDAAAPDVKAADAVKPHRFLPIVPLVAMASRPTELPPFEEGLSEVEWNEIEGLIRRRVKALGRAAIESELPRLLGHGFRAKVEMWVLKNVLWPALLAKQVTDRAIRAVRENVTVH